MRARFHKPVYDGDPTTVTSAADGADGLTLACSARGLACAEGSARRTGAAAPTALLGVADMPALETRPKASMESLKVGSTLGTLRETYTREAGLEHIEAVRDDAALYDDGRIANAAWLLRRANYVLADNVKLGPWIHVESAIDMHSLLHGRRRARSARGGCRQCRDKGAPDGDARCADADGWPAHHELPRIWRSMNRGRCGRRADARLPCRPRTSRSRAP